MERLLEPPRASGEAVGFESSGFRGVACEPTVVVCLSLDSALYRSLMVSAEMESKSGTHG
jgi:hypothetical protein